MGWHVHFAVLQVKQIGRREAYKEITSIREVISARYHRQQKCSKEVKSLQSKQQLLNGR